LVLNKVDLLKEKIEKFNLNICFEEYKGGKNFENALNFIEATFKNVVEDKRLLHIIKNCVAIDSTIIESVFKETIDFIKGVNTPK